MRTRMILLASLVALGVGCARTSSRQPASLAATEVVPITALKTYAIDRDRFWPLTVRALNGLGHEIKEMDFATGTIETDWTITESHRARLGLGESTGDRDGTISSLVVFPPTKGVRSNTVKSRERIEAGSSYSTDVDPSDEIGVWSQCRHRFDLALEPAGSGSTLVRLTTTVECWETVQRKAWTPCDSRGVLEGAFLDSLASRVAAYAAGL